MKVALCGYPPLAMKIQSDLQNSDYEFKFFIGDFISPDGKDEPINLPLINFFEFRRLINAGELDGVIVAETAGSKFVKNIVRLFKFGGIQRVGVLNKGFNDFVRVLHWLDKDKFFLPYAEADITDACNLKCIACYHFANFSLDEDFYPIEIFRRDIHQITRNCDILTFRLLGGEPFILNSIGDYVTILRQYLPQARLRIVSNGTLIPSLPQKTLDILRNNQCGIDISTYQPTLKVSDKIKAVLDANGIPYNFSPPIELFHIFLTMNNRNDPEKSQCVCKNEVCRSVYKGKLYKCPLDAFYFKMVKKFGLKNFPASMGVDIYASNFSSLASMLDGKIEMCHWCGEHVREIPWKVSGNPKFEDWLFNPDELKNF